MKTDERNNDGGPAFPKTQSVNGSGNVCSVNNTNAYIESKGGMSLRDYLAAKAMQGLLSNPNVVGYNDRCGWSLVNCTTEQFMQECYLFADGMLVARKTPQP